MASKRRKHRTLLRLERLEPRRAPAWTAIGPSPQTNWQNVYSRHSISKVVVDPTVSAGNALYASVVPPGQGGLVPNPRFSGLTLAGGSCHEICFLPRDRIIDRRLREERTAACGVGG